MTHKFNLVVLVFLAFVVAPFAWLMLNASTRSDSLKPVTLDQLRDLAVSLPGKRPSEVRYETIGRRRVVSDLLAAGTGLRPIPFIVRAYAVIMPDGSAVTIDRGMTRQAVQGSHLSDFDPRAQAKVERAVRTAKLALVLTPEVRPSGQKGTPAPFDSGSSDERQGPLNSPYAVAPGIVVVPTDRMGSGEHMVYVRLNDDRELLLTGDVAPIHAAWLQQRPPARLATQFLVPCDRENIAAWLRTIHAWKAAEPKLQIVAGHDSVLPRMLKRGFIPANENPR